MFYLDPLALIMVMFVGFMGVITLTYSVTYFRSEPNAKRILFKFFIYFLALMALFVCDVLWVVPLILGFVLFSLRGLMAQNPHWPAAVSAIWYASRYWLVIIALFGVGCIGLSLVTQNASIADLSLKPVQALGALFFSITVLGLIILASIWPFHRWLIATLNAPTPVSAALHAGLIGVVGFWIARWNTVIAELPWLQSGMVMLGLASFVMGWCMKQVSGGYKNFLAYSTVSQMGFMLIQGGFGLVSLMIGHIILHGLFKAACFLNQSNCILHFDPDQPMQTGMRYKMMALSIGIGCVCLFAFLFALPIMSMSTMWLVYTMLLLTIAQLVLITTPSLSILGFCQSVLVGISATLGYSAIVFIIDNLLPMSLADQVGSLSWLHVSVIFALGLMWWTINSTIHPKGRLTQWLRAFYVNCVNQAMPPQNIITSHRRLYGHKVIS